MTRVDADGSRWIIGGVDGALWLLRLQVSVGAASSATSSTTLVLSALGLATPPRALVHLTDGYVFVGSAFGDSQLLRLSSAPLARSLATAPPAEPSMALAV